MARTLGTIHGCADNGSVRFPSGISTREGRTFRHADPAAMDAPELTRAQEKLRALMFIEMGLREDGEALSALAQEPPTAAIVQHLVGLGIALADRAYGPAAVGIVAEWRQQAAAALMDLEQP